MSDEFSFWVEHTISGALYMIAGLFFILFLFNGASSNLFCNLKDYAPYYFVGFITLSSIIGYSAQKILECFIGLICHKNRYDASKDIKMELNDKYTDSLRKRYHNFYIVLVLYRHLIIGTILNWISLSCWFSRNNLCGNIIPLSIICFVFCMLFVITYYLHRRTYIQFKEALNNAV